jgi:hypothetical protein
MWQDRRPALRALPWDSRPALARAGTRTWIIYTLARPHELMHIKIFGHRGLKDRGRMRIPRERFE